jgi:lipoprotein-releasing system permease protein
MIGRFEHFLSLRYLKPQRTFVSTITVLSVLGVTLSVMVLIVVLSVMKGFEQELQEKVIGFNAHIVLSNQGNVMNPDATIQVLQKERDVTAFTPYVSGPVLAEFNSRVSTPIVRGIDPESEDRVLPIKQKIVNGEYELRGNSILVGFEWAYRYGVTIGDKVLIYSPGSLGDWKKNTNNPKNTFLPQEMIVTGIFQTGMYDYDLNFMITSLINAQRFYRIDEGVHGISLRLQDPFQAEQFKSEWNRRHHELALARTWMDQNRPLFNAIQTEQVVMTFVLLFIMIVAAFGLCSTLITITVQKRKEIGLLKALGAKNGQIMTIFLLHGAWVGIIGSGTGVILAQIVLKYRNEFRVWLQQTFHSDPFAASVYQFPNIPAAHHPMLSVTIALAALLICLLASAIPARQAASIPPSRALRNE